MFGAPTNKSNPQGDHKGDADGAQAQEMRYPVPHVLRRAVAVELTSRLQKQAAGFARSAKVLNLCRDSNYRTAVIFLTTAQNKFINRLRLSEAERNFRTVGHRYADK
jgi:hypothetical protein